MVVSTVSPTFQKSDRSSLYWLNPVMALATGDDYRIAFLPSSAPTAPSYTLATAWADGGLFLFLNASQPAVEAQTDFVPTVQQLLNDPDFRRLRWLWLHNPAAPFSTWRFQSLAVESARGNQPAFVRRPTQFQWQNYGLAIARGTTVTLNAAQTGWLFTRAPKNDNGLILLNASSNAALTGIDTPIQLSLAGPQAGCWQVDLTLKRPGPSDLGYQELAALDIGLRICCKDPAFFDPDQSTIPQADFVVTHQHYPFLSEDPADLEHYPHDLTLYASLDPLHPLDRDRTYFGFVNAQGQTTAAMPSCFHTHLGHLVHLTPHNALSRLVFAVLPSGSQPNPDDPFYLVPQGEFEISVPPHADYTPPPIDQNLLCGLSGVEYVKLPQNRTSLLCFRPGYPAFAPNFIPGVGLNATVQGEPLTDLATTSWAFVRQAEASLTYYAQPDQAVLHSLDARPANPPTVAAAIATPAAPDLLWYMEVPAAELPPAVATNAHSLPTVAAFPMLPYGGVARESLADYQRLEQQVLSPHRRAVITDAIAQNPRPPVTPIAPLGIAAAIAPPSVTGTTPQGFLAEFSPDYAVMQSLLLARDTADQRLQFHNLAQTDPLRAALQSNQLFLVITNPESLRQHFGTDNQLTIQGWQFNLDPAAWKQHGTFLIFKFYDQPATDLIQSLSTWSQPQIFSTDQKDGAIAPDLHALSQRLSQFFQQDILAKGTSDLPKDRENYGALAKALQSPTWSGVLAFNVSVPPENFPDDLKALAAGIDGDRFLAQYVGIETTLVVPEGGKLVAKPSSLFGLIDYQAEVKPVSPALDYDFQVQTLRVLFQNSQIKAFSSDVSITLNALFGERAQLFNPGAIGNTVLLKGTTENHNGKTIYAFSFIGDNIFALPGSPILKTIKIIKAQFTTDPIITETTGSQKITGRFTFWGQLNFRKLAKFDIFSFGAEEPADPQKESGLSFSNLVITLAFQKNPIPADPQAPANAPTHFSLTPPEFKFNPRNLLFDRQRSHTRIDSLHGKFPLKFKEFIYTDDGKTPSSLGYLPVKSPLGNTALGNIWYGLSFELELGDLGALAGKAGLFVTILAAWKPNGSLPDTTLNPPKQEVPLGVAIGLKMPSLSGGRKELAILGLIKIVFKSIEFIVGKLPNGRPSYLLKLKNIMIKVLILSLPPSGQTEIIIFGDPEATADTVKKAIGWYAAYAKDPTPQPGQAPVKQPR
jgi:hypothetical protein